MTKKTKKMINNKGHMVYRVNTVDEYIKKENGDMINVKKLASGLFLVWGAFNKMLPEGMTESQILALC